MATLGRRSFLKSATLLTAGGIVASSAILPTGQSLGQGVPGNSEYGVKALFFDMFGTVLDWRTGVARSAEAILKPRGYSLDWLAFADAWRAQYQPGMEEVRSGRIPYTKLDVLHRRMLDLFLPRFGIAGLPEDVLHDLTLSWHRLDGWPDVATGLPRLGKKFLLAPVSNGNTMLMADIARRNGMRFDAILGADVAQDYKPRPRVYQASAEAFARRLTSITHPLARSGDRWAFRFAMR